MFKALIQKLRGSLAAKISLLTGGLIFLSVIIFSAVFALAARYTLTQDSLRADRIFSLYSTDLAYNLYAQFYSHPAPSDFAKFRTHISELLSSNTDVVYIQLVALNGKILYDSREAKVGKYEGPERFVVEPDILKLVQQSVPGTHETENETDGVSMYMAVPVNAIEGAHVLSTVYGFSFDSLRSRLQSIYILVGLLAVIIMVIGLGLPVIFISHSVRPLLTLTQAAQVVGQGNYDVQVHIDSKDEIGTLATAFTQMASGLKKSRTELTDKLAELENLNKLMVGRELRMIELKEELKKAGKEVV